MKNSVLVMLDSLKAQHLGFGNSGHYRYFTSNARGGPYFFQITFVDGLEVSRPSAGSPLGWRTANAGI